MKIILEHMGQTVIAVVVAGGMLLLFLTGQNAQTREIGAILKERQEAILPTDKEDTMGKVRERAVEFSYEEQCFQVGVPVDLTKYFTAKKQSGRKLKVKLEEIFPKDYEKNGKKICFQKEGVYEVRVSAGGYLYEVCIPVIQYAD